MAAKNVELTLAKIKAESSVLNEMLQANEIKVVGAMYDVASGKVSFL